eukprot:7635860-Karenia_brevis.AAC.1
MSSAQRQVKPTPKESISELNSWTKGSIAMTNRRDARRQPCKTPFLTLHMNSRLPAYPQQDIKKINYWESLLNANGGKGIGKIKKGEYGIAILPKI